MTEQQKHTVVQGDTLSGLALKYYGNGEEAHWRKIYEANKALIGDDPNLIKPGQELVIPPGDAPGGTRA